MALQEMDKILYQLEETLQTIDKDKTEKAENMILQAREVFCLGSGRTGLGIRGFAMRLMHLGLKVNIIGDTLARPIGEDDILVISSASGNSNSMAQIANKAREYGAKVILITSREKSYLTDNCDLQILIQADSKEEIGTQRKAILPMGSLFEEASFILFDIMAYDLMKKTHQTNNDMLARHANLE